MGNPGPGAAPLTERTPRVVAARKLHRRRERDQRRRFLAEGPQAVREALAGQAVVELYATAEAPRRHPELFAGDVPVWWLTDRALQSLCETVTPQGVVAVCRRADVPLAEALASPPRLMAVLAEARDPGNAGTVLRTADAAGASLVWFTDRSVDPYNGKCVRSSAGSLFHLTVATGGDPLAGIGRLRAAGLRVYAADGAGESDLDDLADAGGLSGPTAWIFGSEAHGIAPAVAAAADRRVRVPIHGHAESLNLAVAAGVCLYASARAHRNWA